jgi:hypothetical protein
MLSVNCAECHKQANYAECHYAECRYASVIMLNVAAPYAQVLVLLALYANYY